MANFYGGSSSGNRSSSGGGGWGGTVSRSARVRQAAQPVNEDAGKLTIDLTKPDAGIGEAVGSAADFVSGLAGGALGVVGQLGIPGGPNLGDVPEAAGAALGAIGQIGIPGASYAADPTGGGVLGGGGAMNLGSLPGAAADFLGWAGKKLERAAAGERVAAAAEGRFSIVDAILDMNPLTMSRRVLSGEFGQVLDNGTNLPPDLQERLDAGASVDEIADELVARGAGYSNDPVTNLAVGVVYDPMNLVSGGVGKGAELVQKAGKAVALGEAATPAQRTVGTIYNVATHGLTEGQQAVVGRFVGPATSGIFHAIGTKPFRTISTGLERLAPEYASSFQKYLGVGAAQLPRAVIARQMGDEAADLTRRGIALADEGSIASSVEARLMARRRIDPAKVERDTEEMLARVAPDFVSYTPERLLTESAQKLALVADMSVEDALRVLGKSVDTNTARTIHLAYYGRAGDDLVEAKRLVGQADNIAVDRLTVVAPDTLTDERALQVLALSDEELRGAVDTYSMLSNRFSGMAFDAGKVREFIAKMRKEGVLPQAVRRPITGDNALPPALGAWRAKHGEFGYDLALSPKGGWKALIDEDTGDVLTADPFVHFVSANEPLTMRNQLGRFVDGLMRGHTQTMIVLDSRARFVQATRSLGISPNQARAIHKNVLNAAAEEGVAPRGLAVFGTRRFDEAFEAVLGPEGYRALQEKANPTYLLMKAFEGNLSRVGLTQKATGLAKRGTSMVQPSGGNYAAALAEGIYPMVRFRLNPLFQLQEKLESPFFNLIRGVKDRTVPEDVAKVYSEMTNLPEFKYLTEAGYFLNIAGHRAAGQMLSRSGRLGKALARFTNVSAGKERARIAQVFSEHPEAFEEAVSKIDPRLWAKMVDEYGTDDAATIADRFIRERLALAENPAEAMRVFDEARLARTLDGDVIREGEEAASQAANVNVGVARGGTVESGGAVKATKPKVPTRAVSMDEEIVWQAFRESFRQASEQAFKTHYFNPQRGWLERTINHPYLGLYPASYMWGKVLPEFTRFLLKRPFGINAPLAGAAAMERVQQQMIAAMADPEFSAFVEENPDVLYLAEMLLPGTPSNLPANAPAWARHISQDAAAGREVNAQTVQREIVDTSTYALGPIRSVDVFGKAALDLADIGGDVLANLNRAAAEYDGMFAQNTP